MAAAAALPVWIVWGWWQGAGPSWPIARPGGFLLLVIAYPVLEEAVFRGWLQGWLLSAPGGARSLFGPLSRANVLTSCAFVAAHLPVHGLAWAAATLVPSLLFGWLRERHGGLAAPIGLHVYYNAGWFGLFGGY